MVSASKDNTLKFFVPHFQYENEDMLPEFDYSLNEINKLILMNEERVISFSENSG